MIQIHHLVILINKLNFDKYMNSNEDEKFEIIGRVLYDNFGDKPTYRNKNVIYGLDKFI